jgi:hypothetical protein
VRGISNAVPTPKGGIPQLPEDFIRDIQQALRKGEFTAARRLAVEGATRYPTHPELQKYAHILAPPRVIRSNVPPTSSVRANRDWLKAHRKDYEGHWVALRNGELVGCADSLDTLMEHVNETDGVLLTKVN